MTRWATTILGLIAGSTGAAEWEPVATELLKAEKTGFGGLCGIAVDRTTGDVLIDLSDRGLFRSSDRGKTWASAVRSSRVEPSGPAACSSTQAASRSIASWPSFTEHPSR